MLSGADLVVTEQFRFHRWSGTPLECYGVVADWNGADGSLTAGRTFKARSLHSVAAASLGLPGSKLRLITPPDSGGSFGIKSAVFAYIVLMGLASRKLGVPVRWIDDRLDLGCELLLDGSSDRGGSHVHLRGRARRPAHDVIEDVGAYVRAPEPATLYRMHGSLSGAYRVRNVAARNRVVLTNTMPSGLNRGFGGPQLYLALERTMTIAAGRLGLDPAELRRKNLIQSDAFPYALRREPLRLRRLRGLPRRRASSSPGTTTAGAGGTAHAEGGLVGVGGRLRRRAVGLEHGLHLARRAGGYAADSPNRKCGGVLDHGFRSRRDHGPDDSTPQGQGHGTVITQIVSDRLGVEPRDVDVLTDSDTSTSPWTIASGNYSSRFSGVGVGSRSRLPRSNSRPSSGA